MLLDSGTKWELCICLSDCFMSVCLMAFLYTVHGRSLKGTVRLFSLKKCCKLVVKGCGIKVIVVH